MEGEMIEYARLGMQRGLLQNKETIHGAGLLNGAGRHALMRYANAMADGNITWMTDGSHGQVVGQPQFTGEFFAEYRALPEIGMTRLAGSGDPVALWYGGGSGARYFYLVNRTCWPVKVELQFSAQPEADAACNGRQGPGRAGVPLASGIETLPIARAGERRAGKPTPAALGIRCVRGRARPRRAGAVRRNPPGRPRR